MTGRVMSWTFAVVSLVVTGAAAMGLYGFLRGKVVEDAYRRKLQALAAEYEVLRERYNRAVEQTAVTQLWVEGDTVAVSVVTADGVLETIETDLDPVSEIHVDFVVRDGRLFIRRVYDDETPPRRGRLIDPGLEGIDWGDPTVARGLSVYRGDLSPGRWIVSTSGNGALDLVQVSNETEVELRGPPPVRRFEALEAEIAEGLTEVTTWDVMSEAARWF